MKPMVIKRILSEGEMIDGDACSLLTGGNGADKVNEGCIHNIKVCEENPKECVTPPAPGTPKPEVNDSVCVQNHQICKTNPDKCVITLPK